MPNERYKIINETEYNDWFNGCPVQIDKSQLLFDNNTNNVILRVRLYNISEEIIKSVYLDIECLDDAMDTLGTMSDVAIQSVNAEPKKEFGKDKTTIINFPKTTYVKFIIKKVVFESETWRNENNKSGIQLPPQIKILNTDLLYDQIYRECNDNNVHTDYWFESNDNYWRCSCGQANDNDRSNCDRCGVDKDWLIKHPYVFYLYL